MIHADDLPYCSPKSPLRERPLFDNEQALRIEALFAVLASDTRIRLLHELIRREEVCVNDLAGALGMKPQAVSNQLARLLDKGILASRRNGNNVLYRIADRCVPVLLERAICLIEESSGRGRSASQAPPLVAQENESP